MEKCPSVKDIICIPSGHFSLVTQEPGVSWFQHSVWAAFADSPCSLQNCNLLASGICPLVGEVSLEIYADFLGGGASACPLEGGAVLGTVMDRVMLGACGLRKPLDSLSSNE